jgi:hypothetical protein
MCLIFACAIASGVSAQTSTDQPPVAPVAPVADPGRPAPQKPIAESPQTMVLNLALSGGSAEDVSVTHADGSPAAGLQTDADALMTYKHHAGRAKLSVNARSVIRYESALRELTPLREEGGLEFSLAGSRSQLRLSQSAFYSPYYQFGAIPDATPTPLAETAQSHGDFANSNLSAFGTATTVDWSRVLGPRVALSASYSLRRTVFDQPALDQTFQSAGMRLTRRLTRFVSLRTGYTYQVAASPLTPKGYDHTHDIDLGVDYSRALAGSTRTTISFSSGISAVPLGQGMAFLPTGSATLARHIGRTWNARLGLSRSVQLLEGFSQPLLTNSVTASFGGALGRHASLSSTATYSTGVGGVAAVGDNGYSDAAGAIGLHFIVSRNSGLDIHYFYASHQYSHDLLLSPALLAALQRQGLRVGFTWRARLLGHGKDAA